MDGEGGRRAGNQIFSSRQSANQGLKMVVGRERGDSIFRGMGGWVLRNCTTYGSDKPDFLRSDLIRTKHCIYWLISSHVSEGLARASMTGSIMHEEKRAARVNFWLLCKLIHRGLELGWNIYGGIVVFSDMSPCAATEPSAYVLIRAILIISYVVTVLRVISYGMAFDSLGKRAWLALLSPEQHKASLIKRWRRWLRRVCLCSVPASDQETWTVGHFLSDAILTVHMDR